MEAVTEELEPEDRFEDLVVHYIKATFELQSAYMEQTLGETLLEIRNCLTEFGSFSHRCICKPSRVQ